MPYDIIKHTADLGIRVSGETLKKLFSDAFLGMMSIIKENTKNINKPTVMRTVSIESGDVTALLVDFLNEVLYLSQMHKELYSDITFLQFSETSIEAKIAGYPVNGFDKDIKAVTYHEADIKKNKKDLLETVLIFDI